MIQLFADEGGAWGELIDDFHHFSIRLHHDDGHILSVEGDGIRVPWSTCPSAKAPLDDLIGAPLGLSLRETWRRSDPRRQCTHWFDLACLAWMQASRFCATGNARRTYRVQLPDLQARSSRPILWRDGERVLDWSIVGMKIVRSSPKQFSELSLRGSAWTSVLEGSRGPIEDDLAEAAWVLRRGVFIGMGRQYDFDRIRVASEFAPVVGGACHTFNQTNLDLIEKLPNTVRDLPGRPDQLQNRGSSWLHVRRMCSTPASPDGLSANLPSRKPAQVRPVGRAAPRRFDIFHRFT